MPPGLMLLAWGDWLAHGGASVRPLPQPARRTRDEGWRMTTHVLAPAHQVDPARLHGAFVAAFADYLIGPFRLDLAQWPSFLARQGIELVLSRVALVEGGIAAFALVAPRDERHWRLGTMGALPHARGTGVAPALLDELVQRATQRGVEQLELEVFAQNERALRLYRSRGFELRHELHGYTLAGPPPPGPTPPVREVDRAEAMDWLRASASRLPMLPLQVTPTCLHAAPDPLLAWQHGQAQLIFSINAAAQVQVQVHSLVDRDPAQGDAAALLRALRRRHPHQPVNVPPVQRLDVGGRALREAGFAVQPLHQWLMVRPLLAQRAGVLTMRTLEADNALDRGALQAVLAAAPAYSLLVEGHLPTPSAADEMLAALPPGKTASDKFVFAFEADGQTIGCADLVRGHPEAQIVFIGLLLFAESAQGRGHGAAALRHIEAIARSWGCSGLRIAVIETNLRALGFWQRQGFNQLYRKDAAGFTGRAIVMERRLPPDAGTMERRAV